MLYKLGIDVGGTFTDFLLCDEAGNSEVYKVPTVPTDPAEGVFNGLRLMAESKDQSLDVFLSSLDVIVHGTTITTNAVLTSSGAKTGFITTKGFRDVLNMRRGLKEEQYETKCEPPSPIVPRRLIQVVEERIDCEGKELVPVNREDLVRAIEIFKQEDVKAVGVSFLFSFFNPLHEQQIAAVLENELPDVYVSISSEILPQIRVYERNSTVALNAYVGPVLKHYLSSLLERLKASDFRGTLLIMQSNGGVMSPKVAMRFACNTLLSGPAGGPTAGLYYASVQGLKNIITVDMGGTSFDACLVKDGNPNITVEATIARHRLATPSIDIHTIGAGGGSVAWIDTGGMLKVGPESAGAVPGPACYGKGGSEPTVTDADLVLGYLEPDYFHGGSMKLDYDAAVNAIKNNLAEPLGMDVVEAAYGIYRIVNSNMAAGLSVVSVARGYDPREFALIVAGGAGPIHAGMIAKELEIPLIIVPKGSSVFCAAGMLMSDLRHDYVRTFTRSVVSVDLQEANRLLQQMADEAMTTLCQEGIRQEKIVIDYAADLRYEGQFNEVEVPVKRDADGRVSAEELTETVLMFHSRHDGLYGYSMLGAPTELINLRVQARGVTDKPAFKLSPFRGADASTALKKYREAFFGSGFLQVPVYDGLLMGYGNRVAGPAIVEEPTTTVVVPPDYDLTCDRYDNYLLYPKGEKFEDLIAKLRGEN